MSAMEEFFSSLDQEQRDNFKRLLENENTVDKQEDTPTVNEDFVVDNRTRTTNTGRTKVKAGKKNEWVDTGEFKDVETPDGERTPRLRKKPKKTTVECHICGKEFKADPRYLSGVYHRCNRCVGR
jgi:hypothetical protein